MRISLCSEDEPSGLTDGSSIARWKEYLSTYVMVHPTEWLPEVKKDVSPVFFKR